jgi:hypothetical protein
MTSLDQALSLLIREMIRGHFVPQLVVALKAGGIKRCSLSLIYKWADPKLPHLPSLKQFILLAQATEKLEPSDLIRSKGDALNLLNGLIYPSERIDG